MNDYSRYKRWFIGLSAIASLILSLWFSKSGFGFNGDGENDWVGWVLAFSASSAQMMVQSDRNKLTWTTLLIGIPAYGYSVFTNIIGFHEVRGAPDTEEVFTVLSVSGGLFLDIFPEAALAWVFGETKLGDWIGNLIYYWKNPEKLLPQTGQPVQPRPTHQETEYRQPAYVPTYPPVKPPGHFPKPENKR